ncbi:MAG: putative polymerase ECF-subfamily sigma factor, partial [Ilumatobacteraceae bacterium]|nr:putative polymerase ECF-subfamily sigma factor [Ilumatobacteraceae bacterium]
MSDATSSEPIRPVGGVPVVDFTMDSAPQLIVIGDVEPLMVRYPSFEDFYRTSRASIGRALAMTLRNNSLAAEAIDEAMARAFQRWPHVSQLDNPGGWVYRVGLNWSRSVVRRLTRSAPPWVGAVETSPAPAVQDPLIDRALQLLTVDQRAVVVCRLLLNLSEASTAEALGIRPGTVKSRL